MSEGLNFEGIPVLEDSEAEVLERRQVFIDNLENADSINAIKKAIDDYSIVVGGEKEELENADEGEKEEKIRAYINFTEDNYDGHDMSAGIARYEKIMQGLDNIERNDGKLSAKFLAENLNDYAIEMAVARVLNVEG